MLLATPLGLGVAIGTGHAQTARVLHLTVPADDGSLTPYTFDGAYPYVTLIYDTLMWRDAEGIPKPWLARSVETSPDGRTVTLRLADGAKWHDDQPVTSDDVAFTFGYVKDHPHPRFTPELDAVDRVDTSDPLTAVVHLRQPSPGFADQPMSDLPILPAHLWRPLPAGKVAPDGLAVGSGPYRLVAYQPTKGYRLEANRSYFRGPPAVGTIEVSIIGSAEQAFSAAARHTVDMVPYKLPLGDVQQLSDLAMRLERGPSYSGVALTLNVRRPPFDNPAARAAVAKALDLDRMALEIGDAVPADRGYLHPKSPWAPSVALHITDVAAATDALAALRLPTIDVLATSTDPVKREAARQVALALQRSGQQAVARQLSPEDLSRAVSGDQPTFTAAIESVPPLASYDPDFLRHVFSGTGAEGLDHSGYQNPAFDALTEQISTTVEPGARRAAVDGALRLLEGDAPVVPLVFVNGTFAVRPSVFNGWVYIKGTGILDKRSFVEPSQVRAIDAAVAREDAGGGEFPWRLVVLALIVAAAGGVIAALVRTRE
jgi:ABC-type transport system substrate-binding protein